MTAVKCLSRNSMYFSSIFLDKEWNCAIIYTEKIV